MQFHVLFIDCFIALLYLIHGVSCFTSRRFSVLSSANTQKIKSSVLIKHKVNVHNLDGIGQTIGMIVVHHFSS